MDQNDGIPLKNDRKTRQDKKNQYCDIWKN